MSESPQLPVSLSKKNDKLEGFSSTLFYPAVLQCECAAGSCGQGRQSWCEQALAQSRGPGERLQQGKERVAPYDSSYIASKSCNSVSLLTLPLGFVFSFFESLVCGWMVPGS